MMRCESCDSPATRKDACGTALCDKCWSADEPVPMLPSDAALRSVIEALAPDTCPRCGGSILGDGYTVVLHCENAVDVDLVEPDADIVLCRPEPEPNYDAPKPLTPEENWRRNDEHNVP